MKKFQLMVYALLAFAMLGFARPVQAAPIVSILDDSVCLGGSRTLGEGAELNGSLVGFGCVIVVEQDAVINGDLVLFGGTIDVDGEVTGDLVAMGAAVTLSENAVVAGDLVAPGSAIFRQDGSQVEGQVVTEPGTSNVEIPDIPDLPDITIVPPVIPSETVFERTTRTAIQSITTAILRLFQTFAFSALAVLLLIFLPNHTERVANTLMAQPIISGGVGLLTAVTLPILLLALTIFTLLVLTPVTALGALLMGLALVFGWIAVGFEVGRKLTEALDQNWAAPLQGGIGTFVLTLSVGAIGIIPFLGFVAALVVGSLGLGAVLLSRFGTQVYEGRIVTVEAAQEAEAKEEKPKPKRSSRRKKADSE